MTRLNLRPLPSMQPDASACPQAVDRGGFVDDEVVMALVAGPNTSRHSADVADLALAADMDFAGWCLSTALPPVTRASVEEPVGDSVAEGRRPAPPTVGEPGIGESHRGGHRWWLAGLAGAVSTLMFVVLLFSLSARIPQEEGEVSRPHRPVEPVRVLSMTPDSDIPETPRLTDASADE